LRRRKNDFLSTFTYAVAAKWFDTFPENRQKFSIDGIKAGWKFGEDKGLNLLKFK